MSAETLRRIADALERIAPPPVAAANLTTHPAYHWDGKALAAVARFAPLPLDLIVGVDRQKADVLTNSQRLAQGHAAHDVLLWGARGMGKSALVKSVVAALQTGGLPLALVECSADQLPSLPSLFQQLVSADRRFLLFIDVGPSPCCHYYYYYYCFYAGQHLLLVYLVVEEHSLRCWYGVWCMIVVGAVFHYVLQHHHAVVFFVYVYRQVILFDVQRNTEAYKVFG